MTIPAGEILILLCELLSDEPLGRSVSTIEVRTICGPQDGLIVTTLFSQTTQICGTQAERTGHPLEKYRGWNGA